MKRILFSLLLLNFVSSCTYVVSETAKVIDRSNRIVPPPPNPNRFEEISVNDNYQISLPSDMFQYDEILDEALISYANHYRPLYTIVFEGDMSNFINYKELDIYLVDSISLIENYKNLYKENVKESSPNVKFEDYGLMQINDFDARQLKLFVDSKDNVSITQIVTLLEIDNQVYHIISWTSKDKLKENIGIMEQIPFTFQKKTIYE